MVVVLKELSAQIGNFTSDFNAWLAIVVFLQIETDLIALVHTDLSVDDLLGVFVFVGILLVWRWESKLFRLVGT